MRNLRVIYIVLVGMVLFLGFVLAWIIYSRSITAELKVIFLDIGQGDATLIMQGDKQIIIDGGKDSKKLLEEMGKYIHFWDRQIEVMIVTHPDYDHYGGLISVLENYEVATIIKTQSSSNNDAYQAFLRKSSEETDNQLEAFWGMEIKLADNLMAKFYYPFDHLEKNIKDKNAGSVVVRLSYGENDFLFTGDLTREKELELVGSGINLESEFLKTGHHGSNTSTAEEFLQAVQPAQAIISVGIDNRYGHPHREVLERLRKHNVKIWRTDKQGNIIVECSKNKKCLVSSEK